VAQTGLPMLTRERFEEITAHYPRLRIAVVGDFCLDRYLEIDPQRAESSLETGLPVHNVVNVRAQPGGAGTIVNNLAALGVGEIIPLGFCGEDGEGHELLRALAERRGVKTEHLLCTPLRRTFTYCKPLVLEPGQPPRELNRLDTKNWTVTPHEAQAEIIRRLETSAAQLDAVILLDQVDVPETGVVTSKLLEAVARIAGDFPALWIMADSRRGLAGYPPVSFKMNRDELRRLMGSSGALEPKQACRLAAELAARQGRHVFVTLAEEGIVGAAPGGDVQHVPALPTRGAIDIVGAGDCVMANLTAALAAKATLNEALHIATAAASIVIHQLGTTGTSSVEQIGAILGSSPIPAPKNSGAIPHGAG
jgi:rfaE bifunctional protein kinase chain/domain